tara:strand:- start:403 stop:513 length:111 start_codon:yes stop_codon:yes gene_type:complete
VKFKEGSDWVFACKQCVLSVKKITPTTDMVELGKDN